MTEWLYMTYCFTGSWLLTWSIMRYIVFSYWLVIMNLNDINTLAPKDKKVAIFFTVRKERSIWSWCWRMLLATVIHDLNIHSVSNDVTYACNILCILSRYTNKIKKFIYGTVTRMQFLLPRWLRNIPTMKLPSNEALTKTKLR